MLYIFALTLCMSANLIFAERNLTDKMVMITGAARGIGYSIGDYMLKSGAKSIIIVDKNETSGPLAAETLRSKYGEDKVVFMKGDVTTDLDDIYEDVLENYGCIDILVNNAGIFNESDPKGMINTNTLAVIEWSIKYRDLMRTDKCSQCGKGGVIINVASIAGHTAAPFMSAYLASKFGSLGWTRSYGHTYNERQTGVSIIGVCPGFTHTAMTENMVVEDYQMEDFNKFCNYSEWQEPDDVGSGTIEIYKNAESGTIWDMVDGAPPFAAPNLTLVTLQDILAMS